MMKKSLSKALARMAKDGDVETVAEILEEMMEPGDDAELKEGTGTAPETGDPAVTVETPEGSVIAVDEGSAAGIIERLDRLITLLTPAAPAEDDDPVEEIAELAKELRGEAATVDARLDTAAKRNLCDNLGGDVELALKVYEAVDASAKPGFRRNAIRRKKVERAIEDALQGTDFNPLAVYQIVEHQGEFDSDSYMSDEPWM